MNTIAIKVGVAVGIGLFSLAVGVFSYIYSNRQNRNPPQGITPENRHTGNGVDDTSNRTANCNICRTTTDRFSDTGVFVELDCGHHFHKNCLRMVLLQSTPGKQCPDRTCRQIISESTLQRIGIYNCG